MAPRPDPVATPDDTYERSFEQQLNNVDYDMLRKTFEAFDADGSGAVDFEEVEAMVASMGMVISPLELYDMLKEADEDGNEVIDFDEFKKIFEHHIERVAEDPESPGAAFAALIQRKATTGPPIEWRADKLAPSIFTVANNPSAIRRGEGGGKVEVKDGLATGNWSVQLLNRWLSTAQYSRASVLLEIESSSGSFMVGVVGSNYNPSDWTRPFDREKHSAGVRAADGHVFVKGVQRPHSTMCRMPKAGSARCRIGIDVDMEKLEMRLTYRTDVNSDSEEAAYASVLVEDIPVEVAVAVALGPSDTEQTVLVIGSSCERSRKHRQQAREEADDDDDPAIPLTPRSNLSGALSAEAEVAATLSQ